MLKLLAATAALFALLAPSAAAWQRPVDGSVARGSGILSNQLYAGVIAWNRVRMIKDPATGKRVSRINAADVRRETAVPALAIVTPETFATVHARKGALKHTHASHQRKPPPCQPKCQWGRLGRSPRETKARAEMAA